MAEHVTHHTEYREPVHHRHVVHVWTPDNIIYTVLDILEILLAFRLILKLFGANVGNTIVSILYGMTNPLVAPFASIFHNADRVVFEWATVIAMLAYAILAYFIIRLFNIEIENSN